MKLKIESSNDGGLIIYMVHVETATFKGCTELYGTPDIFTTFANNLLAFPFKSKKPVKFNGRHYLYEKPRLKMEVLLKGRRGEIEFRVDIRDGEGNDAHFSGYPLETQALQDLSHTLLKTDFNALEASVEWETHRS